LTVDEILAEVEKRMGALDERTKQAVTLALQLAEQHGLPKWQGENPTWDEWQRMSEEGTASSDGRVGATKSGLAGMDETNFASGMAFGCGRKNCPLRSVMERVSV
jgi:hypothetical protein